MNLNRINQIKELLEAGQNETQIAHIIGLSKQGTNYLVRKYLPQLSKQYRKQVKIQTQRLTDLQRAQHARFQRKRANAKQIGIEFALKQDEVAYPTHCPILGLELDYFAETRQENCASFDRLDSSKGYIKDNVVIVSWRANRIKNDGTAEEHRRIADFMDYGY